MKSLKTILWVLVCFFSMTVFAQQGVTINNKGAAAKSTSGKGVEANKKGLEVKGSKRSMTIKKKKLEIKSKNVNINLGKK